MIRVYLSFLLSLSFVTAFCTEPGLHFVENYVTPTYGAGGQTWQIGIYDDTWVYFANRDGVFEYDGDSWRNYPMNNGHDARAVFPSHSDGRVYVSGINEFGFLSPSDDGRMKYVCLSDSLDDRKNIGNLWGIYLLDGNLCLQGDYSVMKYGGGEVTVIPSDVKLDMSALIDGVVYFGTEHGLKMLVGSRLLTARGTEALAGQRIRAVLPMDGRLLIVTASSGLYDYDGQSLKHIPTDADARISAAEVYCAAVNGGTVALGTVLDGAFIVDLSTGRFQNYNQWNGLQNETVLALSFDSRGDLWVGTDSGIDRIRLTEPVMTLNSRSLQIGSGYASVIKDGTLYLGTNRGLFSIRQSVAEDVSGRRVPYESVAGLRGQVWDLKDLGGTVFCAHDRGLFTVSGNEAERVGEVTGVWTVCGFDDDDTRAWIGTYTGIYYMRRDDDGKWHVEGRVDGFGDSSYNIVQEGPCDLWVYKNPDGCVRLGIDPTTMSVKSYRLYDKSDGLPAVKDIHVSRIGDRTSFATSHGVYYYDASRDTIVPDNVINGILGASADCISMQMSGNRLFILTPTELISIDRRGDSVGERLPVLPAMARPLNMTGSVYVHDDSIAVMPNFSGYTIFNFGTERGMSQSVDRYGRINSFMVTTPVDSVIYANNFLSLKKRPEIPYGSNSVKISYGLDSDPLHRVSGYRYRLNRGPWSEPTLSTVKEYTDLAEGNYTFEVKATLFDGTESTDSFSFVILAPWYRSNFAYILYVFVGIALFFGIYLFEKKRVRRKELSIAEAKDAELVRQREHFEELDEMKERQIAGLEKEKLRDQLEHKSQEITNLLMTMAGKHETLIAVKQDLRRIYASFSGNAADRQALEALERRVDSSLQSESVMDRIEKEFDLVHNDFIKKLKSAYPELTRNEVLMCAYVKMNLSNKEIAPLMNLSPRGVETTRYRMRKKFSLGRDASLTEFLHKFS